jgi:hypothetical protein
VAFDIKAFDEKRYSQFGEDGITHALIRRLDPPHSFLEIGCGDGTENCTRILTDFKWTGLWVDRDPANASLAIEVGTPLGVRVICAHVSLSNIAFYQGQVPQELGVLSIDVDGNDYHLWKGLCVGPYALRPYIVIIEALIVNEDGFRSDDDYYVMPYIPEYVWDQRDHSSGSTVAALKTLGGELGYTYLGRPANPHSPNCFFIRNDLLERL